MTAMPPEPDFRNLPPPPAYPPPVYPPPDQYAPRRRPRAFSVVRIACGVLWAAFTVILAVGTVMEWLTGLHAASIMCFVFAVGCGWYDYRIWTFKARRLWFLPEGLPERPVLAPVPRRRPDRHRNIAGVVATSMEHRCSNSNIDGTCAAGGCRQDGLDGGRPGYLHNFCPASTKRHAPFGRQPGRSARAGERRRNRRLLALPLRLPLRHHQIQSQGAPLNDIVVTTMRTRRHRCHNDAVVRPARAASSQPSEVSSSRQESASESVELQVG